MKSLLVSAKGWLKILMSIAVLSTIIYFVTSHPNIVIPAMLLLVGAGALLGVVLSFKDDSMLDDGVIIHRIVLMVAGIWLISNAYFYEPNSPHSLPSVECEYDERGRCV